jgi:hypothetical protein
MGSVTRMRFSSGTSMTLNTSSNPSLKGVIFRIGSAIGDTGVMMAYGRYGRGKFVGLGDSSPADDGTGDLNDVLYDGWAAEVNGDHGKVITNATIWVAAIDNITGFNKFSIENNFYWNIFPNPAIDEIKLYYQLNETSNIIIELHNSRGEKVKQYVYENQQSGSHYITMNDLSNGFYFIKINVNGNCFVKRLIVSGKE